MISKSDFNLVCAAFLLFGLVCRKNRLHVAVAVDIAVTESFKTPIST